MTKKVVVFAVAVALYGCYAERNVQVNIVNAKLVKIDTVYRYRSGEQLLVWKGSNNVQYVSYTPLERKLYGGCTHGSDGAALNIDLCFYPDILLFSPVVIVAGCSGIKYFRAGKQIACAGVW